MGAIRDNGRNVSRVGGWVDAHVTSVGIREKDGHSSASV